MWVSIIIDKEGNAISLETFTTNSMLNQSLHTITTHISLKVGFNLFFKWGPITKEMYGDFNFKPYFGDSNFYL